MEKTEQQRFLEELEVGVEDVFEKPLTEETVVEPEKKEETAEETEQKAKNRRERRLLEKNQQLREEAIASNARLQALTEAKQIQEGAEPADYLGRVEKIYGNATPEAAAATELLKSALEGLKLSAKQEALQEFDKQRGAEKEATRKEEEALDHILETVEDEHGIDMSGDDRKGFLALLEKLSPKDKDGNIIEYADSDATAELYLSRKEKPNDRAKELASRSMTRSGSSAPTKIEEDATVRYLKENGII